MRDASQFPRFSESEMAGRHRRVAAFMEEQKLDAVLFYGTGRFTTDIYWLSDWPGGREAYVLFQAGAEPLMIAQLFNHVPMARVLSVIEDVRWAGPNTADTVVQAMGDAGLNGKRIGLVGGLSYRHYQAFQENLSDAKFTDVSSAFRMMRTVRSAAAVMMSRLPAYFGR